MALSNLNVVREIVIKEESSLRPEERVVFKVPKILLDAINTAAAKRFCSRSQYVRDAVLARLKADNGDLYS